MPCAASARKTSSQRWKPPWINSRRGGPACGLALAEVAIAHPPAVSARGDARCGAQPGIDAMEPPPSHNHERDERGLPLKMGANDPSATFASVASGPTASYPSRLEAEP